MPNPQRETEEHCARLLFEVAEARGARDPEAYANALIAGCLTYPCYPRFVDTPVASWLTELERAASVVGDDDVPAFVAARRAMLLTREGDLDDAARELARVADSPHRTELRSIAAHLLTSARAAPPDADTTVEHLAGREQDPILQSLACLALAERASATGGDALTAFRTALDRTPGPCLDTRLHALARSIELDDERASFMAQLVCAIYMGSGRALEAVVFATQHPSLIPAELLREASAMADREASGAPETSHAIGSKTEEPASLSDKLSCIGCVLLIAVLGALVAFARLI